MGLIWRIWTQSQTSVGTVPTRPLFPLKSKLVKLESSAISEGTVPVNLLWSPCEMGKKFGKPNCHQTYLLSSKNMDAALETRPSSVGIVPLKSLPAKESVRTCVSKPTLVDNVPLKALLPMSKLCMVRKA